MENFSKVSSTVKEKNDAVDVESNSDIKEGEILLKVLVPAVAASVIMGRREESREYLQRDVKANISFNKENDYYPGTTERACLIVGSVRGVRAAHDYVVDKMYDVLGASGKLTVKLLVPNSTVGMVIGKNGEYIRRIKDSTSTYIQVSQKSADRSLLERCITIAGDCRRVKKAVDFVIDKIAADPNSSSCPSINYSEATTALPSVRPTGSPYAARVGANAPTDGSYSNTGLNREAKLAVNSLYLHTHNITSHPMLDQLKSELRLNGFSDQSAGDVLAAVYTLASYGLLQLHSPCSGQYLASDEGASMGVTNTMLSRKRTHEFKDMSGVSEKRVYRGANKILSRNDRSEGNVWNPEPSWQGDETMLNGSQGYENNESFQPVNTAAALQNYRFPIFGANYNVVNESSLSTHENGHLESGEGYENYYEAQQWPEVVDNNSSKKDSYVNNCSSNGQQTYSGNGQKGQLAQLNYWQPNNTGYNFNYEQELIYSPPPPSRSSFPVASNCPPVVPTFLQNGYSSLRQQTNNVTQFPFDQTRLS